MCSYPVLFLLLQSANCNCTQYPATAPVKLLSNGRVVADGIAVEGLQLHGKNIPLFYQKVAITSVLEETKLLFRTPLDENEYITVGEVVAWPLSLMQS